MTKPKKEAPPSKWLTASEAAEYLRVVPRTVLHWARQGKIKGFMLSGTQRVTWRFLTSDLDAALAPNTTDHNAGK